MSENELSWPSAVCAVLFIAISAMSQPAGKVLGYPMKHSFFLRACPLVCAYRVWEGLVPLVSGVITRRSLKDGVALWIANRLVITEVHREPRNYHKLRTSVTILLGFGSMLQAIKIFSCRGVFWTQLVCSIYLLSFLVDALLLAMVPKDMSPDMDVKVEEASTVISAFRFPKYINSWMLAQGSIQAEHMFVLFTLIYHQNYVSVAGRIILASLSFTLQSIINFCLVRYIFDTHFRQPKASTADVLVSGNLEMVVYGTANGAGAQIYTDMFPATIFHKIGLFLAAATPAILLRLSWFKARSVEERERRRYLFVFLCAFLTMHILCVSIYYWQMYSTAGTYRPGWTRLLG